MEGRRADLVQRAAFRCSCGRAVYQPRPPRAGETRVAPLSVAVTCWLVVVGSERGQEEVVVVASGGGGCQRGDQGRIRFERRVAARLRRMRVIAAFRSTSVPFSSSSSNAATTTDHEAAKLTGRRGGVLLASAGHSRAPKRRVPPLQERHDEIDRPRCLISDRGVPSVCFDILSVFPFVLCTFYLPSPGIQ